MAPPTGARIQKAVCQSVRASRIASTGAMMEVPIPPADCWIPTARPNRRLNHAATVVGILTRNKDWEMPSIRL